jgi:GNAT superfamily N-acetyltransferase
VTPLAGLAFRKAAASDSTFAYETREAALRPYLEQDQGWDEQEQHDLHQRRFAAHDFRIITTGERDAGVMALERQTDCLRLHQLFLLPEYQGRGIGSQCVQGAMEEARASCLRIRVQVLKANARAVSFYVRLGFVQTDSTCSHVVMEWSP